MLAASNENVSQVLLLVDSADRLSEFCSSNQRSNGGVGSDGSGDRVGSGSFVAEVLEFAVVRGGWRNCDFIGVESTLSKRLYGAPSSGIESGLLKPLLCASSVVKR